MLGGYSLLQTPKELDNRDPDKQKNIAEATMMLKNSVGGSNPDLESNSDVHAHSNSHESRHEDSNASRSSSERGKRNENHLNLNDSSIFKAHTSNDLMWRNVSISLMNKKTGDVTKQILDSVWGNAKAGSTTAIMGASGAGKTSLFQMLAGRTSTSSTLQTQGNIFLGGVKINPRDREVQRRFGYISQQDELHQSSTPRECLAFAAKLRLPRTWTQTQIDELVSTMIIELGLTQCCDQQIGGTFKRGISGGETRRVSIGVELIARPSIIFADEPTSGLDSFAATKIMKLLDRLARAGNTVLFTIHQPSSNLFSTFDRLLLLCQGRVMYQGDTMNVCEDFAKRGYAVPKNYNPADWILDVSQTHEVEELSRKGFFVPGTWAEGSQELQGSSKDSLEPLDNNHVSLLTELKLLQKRENQTLYRNPAPMLINVGVTSFLAVVFGLIFWDVGREDRAQFSAVQSQLGAIVNILISTLMGQSNTAMMIFAAERPVFLREYSTNHYNVATYFLSHLCSEAIQSGAAVGAQSLIVYWMIGFQMAWWQFFTITYCLALTATAVSVMLGAFFSNPRSAAGLYTLVVVPQFYFSGLFIAIEYIPSWISWAQYLCSMTYASRIALAYEFGECGEDGSLAQGNCDELLSANRVSKNDVWWYWLSLMGLFVLFRLGAVYVLHRQASY